MENEAEPKRKSWHKKMENGKKMYGLMDLNEKDHNTLQFLDAFIFD